jgi:hypothetical protein
MTKASTVEQAVVGFDYRVEADLSREDLVPSAGVPGAGNSSGGH